ncbi:ABC transporter ATP-binding protein [Marispirochaeta aestuarii]|uniref:ABC transporter ATP-binding protein n=1 Tax=Marispirochaeta aestuarii TaxID=1963862 RepID=UPI000BBA1E3B|nr:ABC transporter ATP-binding protein [Marispirochaeta aestuarii]
MSSIIRVEGLTKNYGSLTAVDHVSFAIEEGICFGLLGPNGAGKTTTIEMMEGILAPTEGTILFRDQAIGANFHERVGIQFQHTALQEFITVEETLKLFSALYIRHRDLEEVIEICSLRDILKQDNRKLSGGQRQRLLLALALVNDPELVFLDEPTTGLDPQARRNFWSLIEKIRAEGKTIILTTHYMDEAQELCDDIAIMDHGHIIARNSPENLLSAHFEGVLVRLPWEESQPLPFPENVRRINNHIEIHSQDVDKTLHELIHAGVHLEGLSIHAPDLEDLFLKLTGSSLRS